MTSLPPKITLARTPGEIIIGVQLNVFNNVPVEATMSVKSYYRWALALPLLVPALASPLALLDAGGVVGVALFFLFWSVVIGGVPYLLFAGGFLLWMRRVPEHRVRRGILLAPLAYTAVLLACFALFLVIDGTLANSSDSLGSLAVFSLFFGYLYVILAEAGRAFLRPGQPRRVPATAV